jgi:hypothetical protein
MRCVVLEDSAPREVNWTLEPQRRAAGWSGMDASSDCVVSTTDGPGGDRGLHGCVRIPACVMVIPSREHRDD